MLSVETWERISSFADVSCTILRGFLSTNCHPSPKPTDRVRIVSLRGRIGVDVRVKVFSLFLMGENLEGERSILSCAFPIDGVRGKIDRFAGVTGRGVWNRFSR